MFHSGVFKSRNAFLESCEKACCFAENYNLQTVFLDTNLDTALSENFLSVRSFRHIACALALQGLFSTFLFTSSHSASDFRLDMADSSCYDLLTVNCVSTETLSFHLSGPETTLSFDQDPPAPKSSKQPIIISKPYIEHRTDGSYLNAQVELNGKKQLMWLSVKKEYGCYLVDDRADSFVAALLPTALRHDMDIICEAPLTRSLLYRLNTYFIPVLSANMSAYHHIRVHAQPADSALECEGAVGTGWTGGVDSMFTYHENLQFTPGYRLTHLLITSNGAIEGDKASETLRKMVEKTEKGFAAEMGLKVIGVDTNFREILDETFFSAVRFRHASVILALQKLFRAFFISSNAASFNIALDSNVDYSYEFLTLNYLSTDTTRLYSSGGACTRIQKLKKLSDFQPAHKYLHPCIYALRDNCGKCGKCLCTITGLYSLGTLENFSKVFDLTEFEKNKNEYLSIVVKNKKCDDYRCYKNIYRLLKKRRINLLPAHLTAMIKRKS